MKKLLLLLAMVTAAGAGCRVAPPQATAVDAERAHVALGELQQGRQLLVQKCGASCHTAPLPSQHTAAEWPKSLDEMGERAKLESNQRRLIEEYLIAMTTKN